MTIKNNRIVRDALRINDVPMYLLAKSEGITDSWLCKKLRFELPEDEQRRLVSKIESIARGDDV